MVLGIFMIFGGLLRGYRRFLFMRFFMDSY